MDPVSNHADRYPSLFAMLLRGIVYSRFPYHFGNETERNPSFPDVALVLLRIEFDLHDLIVYTTQTVASHPLIPSCRLALDSDFIHPPAAVDAK
jgi:hypothetical protein